MLGRPCNETQWSRLCRALWESHGEKEDFKPKHGHQGRRIEQKSALGYEGYMLESKPAHGHVYGKAYKCKNEKQLIKQFAKRAKTKRQSKGKK
jgi:hypothetical protein